MTDTLQDGSWTVFGVPESHWHCQFSNYRWDEVRPPSLCDTIKQFLVEIARGETPHLLLTGPPGLGKTHLAVATYRWGAAQYGTWLVNYVNVPRFCDRVKSGYGDRVDPFSEYEDAKRLVVLDDLFGRDLSNHEASQIVYRMIDTTYQNNAAVLINMNQPLSELPERLPKHEVSRVLANARVVNMNADKDFRRRKQ